MYLRHKLRRAFTLIELLVVIAIIAILAAILFPVFAQAKAAAKGAVCISNMKQFALAWVLYADDYDDEMATDFESNVGPTGLYYYWFWDNEQISNYSSYPYTTTYNYTGGLLYPYTKNYSFLFCPIDPLPAIEPHIGEYTPSYTLNENVKYGSDYTNGNFSGQENGTNFSVVQEPASTFLAGDSATFWTSETPFEVERNDDVIAYGQDYPSPNAYGAFDFANRFQADHNGGASVAWLDGHAKHVHIDTTYAGCTPLFAQYVAPCSQVNPQITAANMGDLVYGARGSANAQYYYLLNKPAGL